LLHIYARSKLHLQTVQLHTTSLLLLTHIRSAILQEPPAALQTPSNALPVGLFRAPLLFQLLLLLLLPQVKALALQETEAASTILAKAERLIKTLAEQRKRQQLQQQQQVVNH